MPFDQRAVVLASMRPNALRALLVVLVLVAFPARADTFEAAVVRIVDGDSLIVLAQRR